MMLEEKIRKLCQDEVTLYGFADINKFQREIFTSKYRGYPRAVSIGMKIPDEIIEGIDSVEGQMEYERTYSKLNIRLNEVADEIVKIIESYSYHAVSINSSYIIPDSNLHGDVSHKFISNLAGLGWIGKSCLLVTKDYGPRLRWASILTDAPLNCSWDRMDNLCGDCRTCVESCPAGAFKNVSFDEKEDRSSRYDAHACFRHFDKLENENLPRLCGVCVKVCPYGIKK